MEDDNILKTMAPGTSLRGTKISLCSPRWNNNWMIEWEYKGKTQTLAGVNVYNPGISANYIFRSVKIMFPFCIKRLRWLSGFIRQDLSLWLQNSCRHFSVYRTLISYLWIKESFLTNISLMNAFSLVMFRCNGKELPQHCFSHADIVGFRTQTCRTAVLL